MENICYNCFRESLNENGVCTLCGFDGIKNREKYPTALPMGSILFGRYIVGRVLGQGGFGITYLAQDYRTKGLVAIKEFYPDTMVTRTGKTAVTPHAGERGENFGYGLVKFLEEAKTMAQFIGNPNITRVYSYFEENNTGYFVMEYLEGHSFQDYIKSHGGVISWEETMGVVLPVMDALEAMHAKGIIHRDVTPDNIYITNDGTVKLLDFGAARYSLGNVSRSLDVILKHGFAPKEQYSRHGKQGPFTDVYSLGATIYYAITGTKPDDAIERLEEDNTPLPTTLGARITDAQEDVVMRALAVMPADRYQNMADFRAAIAAIQPKPNLRPEPAPAPKIEPKSEPKPAPKIEPKSEPKPAPKPEPKSEPEPEPKPEPKTKKKLPKWLIPAVAAIVVVVGGIGLRTGKPAVDHPESRITTAATEAAVPASTGGTASVSRKPEESTKPASTGEKVTVTMIAAQYGPKTGDWWTEFEKKFEAANDGIDLVVDCVSWNDIYTVVNTRIANSQAPDLLNIDVFADFQADGLLLPAEEWCSPETYAKFYQAFLEQSEIDGTIWAVPDLASARAMYYNKDILDAAGVAVPTTWEELKTTCKAIKAYNPGIYPWGIDMTTDEGQAAFAYYTWGNGGGFVDDNDEWILNSAENVAAVEYAVGLVKAGLTNSNPATNTRYDLQDLFCSGKLAMMIAPHSLSDLAGGAGIHYGFAAIPNNSGTSVSPGVMDRIMCFDNDYTDAELDAITAVVDAFYDDESYAEWVLMEGFLPATSTGGEACAAADPAMGTWIDILSSARFYPVTKAEWADVKRGVIDVEQQALLGRDVQTLLDRLQAKVTG